MSTSCSIPLTTLVDDILSHILIKIKWLRRKERRVGDILKIYYIVEMKMIKYYLTKARRIFRISKIYSLEYLMLLKGENRYGSKRDK